MTENLSRPTSEEDIVTTVTTALDLDLDTFDLPTAPEQPVAVVSDGTASPKQRTFIETLLAERVTSGTPYEGWKPNWGASTPRKASIVIEALLALPRKPREDEPVMPSVPDGRYALVRGTDDTDLRFYKVNTPSEGRWAGFTFVAVMASDDEHPIRNRVQKEAILAAIAADPRGASEAYGREIGRCGHCGRTLTDADSRARGIGPVCAEKMGW